MAMRAEGLAQAEAAALPAKQQARALAATAEATAAEAVVAALDLTTPETAALAAMVRRATPLL
jgi:hypothetical protein